MGKVVNALVTKWLGEDEPDIVEIMQADDLVRYLSSRLFRDYEPTQFDFFDERLDRWIGNVPDERDQKLLYRLLGRLFFVGRLEFESLCRAAFNGPVQRWIIDTCGIDLTTPEASHLVDDAVGRTWFCPMTDSMRINAFLKVNHLDGHKYRPDWSSLSKMGDGAKVRAYMGEAGIDRLVLLEDFVGSGRQMKDAIVFATASVLPSCRVLACPLVICPAGMVKGRELAAAHGNLSFEPVLGLSEDEFVTFEEREGETEFDKRIRAFVGKYSNRMKTQSGPGTHGFDGTGALVVMYSNCPNNTLPIVHQRNTAWEPIFPRITRR